MKHSLPEEPTAERRLPADAGAAAGY